MDYTISQANRENNKSFFSYEPVPIPPRNKYGWGSGFFDPTPMPKEEEQSHLKVVEGAEELHALLDDSFFNPTFNLTLSKCKKGGV